MSTNYCSLTSVVCKLMESILRDKIVVFLEKNNIIRDSQHGFRNKRSCLTNLDFLHDIYKMYEEGRAVDIIYLHFQKAFNKVPHRKLLNELEFHGISSHIHRWISDWLSNRKQSCFEWKILRLARRFKWSTSGLSIRSHTLSNIY